ncbi:DUF1361 domain-containing protein, partial [Staphylococcus aureus]|nr:DUF1361 domain-containing protein [Staphylococcus aureus]
MQSRYIARIYFLILFIVSLFETKIFQFMTLNLFLAYIPFELSLLLRLFKPNKKYEWPLFIIYSFIFVLLLPNTFYMVTEFKDLKSSPDSCVKCYTMFLPFLLIKIDVF